MTTLQTLLTREGPAGLHRWPRETRLEDGVAAATKAGWQVVRLSTQQAAGKAAFLEATAAAFDLPSWFGHNWDALEECLGDLEIERGLLVVWEGWAALARAHRASFKMAYTLFLERSEDVDLPPFLVLLHGDGPTLESLDLPKPHQDF